MNSPQSSDMSRSASNLSAASLPDAINRLYLKLISASEKTQLTLVQELTEAGEAGFRALMQFLTQPTTAVNLIAAGAAYQALYAAKLPEVDAFLQTNFPTGIVPLCSDAAIDYAPLQVLLTQQDFLAADKLTLQKLCELAGPPAVQRKWIYFTEVMQLPIADLQTIDTLWRVHSMGQFGFSVQRELWLSVGQDWEKLWLKIGWKAGNNWTRYPQAFTWNLAAPRGHLPLSNQLRGVRVMAALMNHPAWLTPGRSPA
jgi:hypothetical protein